MIEDGEYTIHAVVGMVRITEGARWGWGGGYPTHLRLCNTLIGHLFEKFALANRTPCFGELTLVARDNRAAAAICRRAWHTVAVPE